MNYLEKIPTILPVKEEEDGMLSGGFAVLSFQEMTNAKGGGNSINNSVCSDNASCKNNGTCAGNGKKCNGNGRCVNGLPITTVTGGESTVQP